jgi:DNA-binding transcriptional LysR family regulator
MARPSTALGYLLTVAEEGQITSAARKLNIAQPTLSQAIAQLESELGVELLSRHARGVTLTPAGEAFLVKSRAALAAEADAARFAGALARTARGAMTVGFVGPPPVASAPELFGAFADSNPDAEISFRDLPFPCGATSTWLGEVDVAFCQPPLAEKGVSIHPVRAEPRAVMVNCNHPLARRSELSLEDALDETFVSFHPEVQREWAGFHYLNDHRGAPPAHTSRDHVRTSLQMAGTMSSSARAITAVPVTDAKLAQQAVPSIVVLTLNDADPAVISLIWRSDNRNPLLDALLTTAQRVMPSSNGV